MLGLQPQRCRTCMSAATGRLHHPPGKPYNNAQLTARFGGFPAPAVRYGAFLRSIPPARRIGDFPHCASRVVNTFLKRLEAMLQPSPCSSSATLTPPTCVVHPPPTAQMHTWLLLMRRKCHPHPSHMFGASTPPPPTCLVHPTPPAQMHTGELLMLASRWWCRGAAACRPHHAPSGGRRGSGADRICAQVHFV